MIYATGIEGFSAVETKPEGLVVSFDSSGGSGVPYIDKSGTLVPSDNGPETKSGNSVINDGMTVYVNGSVGATVDLSTGLYGTAVNIDASSSTGYNQLAGNAAANIILGGSFGNFIWGGEDTANDILVGGYGYGSAIFVSGKNEGSDSIINAGIYDTVFLRDVTVSDIVATSSDGNTVGILFNTGNVLTVSGTSAASADFKLADGSRYWYDFSSKEWYQST